MGNCFSRGPHSNARGPVDGVAKHAIALAGTNRQSATERRLVTKPHDEGTAHDTNGIGPQLPRDSTSDKPNSANFAPQTALIAPQNTRHINPPDMTNRKWVADMRQPVRSYRNTPNGGDAARGAGLIATDSSVVTALPSPPWADSVPEPHADLIGSSSSGGGPIVANGDEFNVIVLPTNTEPDPTSPTAETDLIRLRRKCSQFRILVIGKANAGKTTLLQKMCNTTEAPLIRDRDGNILDPSIVNPTDGRGIHDINYELTFSSNSGFVFHDSCGFEAGSTKELEAVQNFIAERAVAGDLKMQLHAIWYCLPTDNDRPLSDAEMSFFEKGTGRVPVIAIFTKYDGMVLREYNRLRYDENCPKKQAKVQAAACAHKLFMTSDYYLRRVLHTPYPPARYLRVQGMHKPESSCADLSKQTIDALDSKKLQLLFVSVQQVNVELCTKYALKNYILEALAQPDGMNQSAMKKTMENALSCYGHLVYNQDDSLLRHVIQLGRHGLVHQLHQIPKHIDSIAPSLTGNIFPESQILTIGISLLIVAEGSLWLREKGISSTDAFSLAWDRHQASKGPRVSKKVEELSGVNFQGLTQSQKVEWVERLYTIVKELRTDSL